MRRKIVAGNWKMNKTFMEAETLLDALNAAIEENVTSDADVIICPPSIYLEMSADVASDGDLSVGAQDVSAHQSGAYTGEISASMLASMGVEYCIVGHSERRKYHGETNALVGAKVEALLSQNLTPIVCCGELLEDREAERHFEVVKTQLREAILSLPPLDFGRLIIAYEPVWAIGTGKTATPDQAQEMHAFIRSCIEETYGKAIAKNTPILYGGSCNAKNAKELFAQDDVDGGLIGGASLEVNDFVSIINAF